MDVPALFSVIEIGVLLPQMGGDLAGLEGEPVAVGVGGRRPGFQRRNQSHVDSRDGMHRHAARGKRILPNGFRFCLKAVRLQMRPVNAQRSAGVRALLMLRRGRARLCMRRFAHSGSPFPGERKKAVQPSCALSAVVNLSLFTTPTNRSTTCPPLKTRSAGMALML